jgi:template-activating factor I
VDEFGASESPSLKRPKRVCEDLHAHLDAIERLQSTLLSLDKACSKDQLEIQRKYDAEKAPLLLQRRIETNKIPSFWATALGNHPATNAEAFLEDREILDLLTSIDLEDNIDDNGSYQLRFVFDSSCNPFFPQSELVRTVTILEGCFVVLHDIMALLLFKMCDIINITNYFIILSMIGPI